MDPTIRPNKFVHNKSIKLVNERRIIVVWHGGRNKLICFILFIYDMHKPEEEEWSRRRRRRQRLKEETF